MLARLLNDDQLAKDLDAEFGERPFGENILPIVLTTVGSNASQTINNDINGGAFTIMFDIVGLTTDPAQTNIGLTGQQFVQEELGKIETNAVELEYKGGGATAAERVLYNDNLTREDENAVLAQLPGIQYSSPVIQMHDRISFAQCRRKKGAGHCNCLHPTRVCRLDSGRRVFDHQTLGWLHTQKLRAP